MDRLADFRMIANSENDLSSLTITAVIVAGPPQTRSAIATHSQSAKTCDNPTGAIVWT